MLREFLQFWEDAWFPLLVASILSVAAYGGYKYNLTLEASSFCYDKVDHVREMASFGYEDGKGKFEPSAPEYYALIPAMNRFAKDGLLTKGECTNVENLLEEAQTVTERKKLQEKLY